VRQRVQVIDWLLAKHRPSAVLGVCLSRSVDRSLPRRKKLDHGARVSVVPCTKSRA
jgi:hypothetical protein